MTNKNILGEQFIELLYLADLANNKKACALLGICERTLSRYKKSQTLPPPSVFRLLSVMSGSLEQIDPEFNGWNIRHGELISSNGERFGVSRLEHIRMEFSFISSYKAKIRELEREVKELKRLLPKANVICLQQKKT